MKNSWTQHLTSVDSVAIVRTDTGVVSHLKGKSMVDFDKHHADRVEHFTSTGGSAANGLTIRDYFAAKAMQTMMQEIHHDFILVRDVREPLVEAAYRMADSMLEERAK